jgi:hypothetical protein
VVTDYTDPSMSDPAGITAGPDGAMWFTNFGDHSIGRITAPDITSSSTATATTGSPFSFTITTAGTPVPSITKQGHLPKHVALSDQGNGTAIIAGIPSVKKTTVCHFTIKAKFGKGKTKTVVKQAFTLTVNPR